jgi:predicted cupin superfamily sugar epimerase
MRDALIERFQLVPHPEGGFYSETFRSADSVHRKGLPEETRSASTAIYYMLCDGAYSAWHRIKSDEVWHFYAGESIDIHVIDGKGGLVMHRLGNALVHPDAVFQAVVLAGQWFAAELRDPSSFALVGCTVAPGFEFSEFELGSARELAAACPGHRELIERLQARGQ